MSRRPILLATTNPAKLAQLRALVRGLPLSPVTPEEAGVRASVDETGASHEANARLKAKAWSAAFGGLALASDGGLVIPALGDAWDSLRTARFAGEGAGDQARTEALLDLLRPLPPEARRASWVEALAVGAQGTVLAFWTRRSQEGFIAEDYRPDQVVPDFWAFTLWTFPRLGKRYPELTEAERREINDHWTQLRADLEGHFG